MTTTVPNPEIHKRRSLRLAEYDYAQPGGYFVTLCTHERECVFGEVVSGEVTLSRLGSIVAACWAQLPRHFPRVEPDAFVVMPNHLHAVLILHDDVPVMANGGRGEAFAPGTTSPTWTPTAGEPAVFPFAPQANASPSPGFTSNRPPVRGATSISGGKGEAFAQNPQGIPLVQASKQPDGASHTPGANASPLPPLPPGAMTGTGPHGTISGSLAAIIQNFKSVTARRINQFRRTPGAPVWQRNYYEHVIRNHASLDEIRTYIANNPARWGLEDEDGGR